MRIIAVVPAGRRRYLRILFDYLAREYKRGLLHELHLWLNTNDPEDVRWILELAQQHSWVKVIRPPREKARDIFTIYQFVATCRQPDTVYVRFDDDIVYLHQDALSELVRFRVSNPLYFLVSANVINNAICTHIHQQRGALGTQHGAAGYDCFDPMGWKSGQFGEAVHRAFLSRHHDGTLSRYMFGRWELRALERFSINCISWFGHDMASVADTIESDEEPWISCKAPAKLQRINCICGSALVSHFAFGAQRPHLDQTDLLSQYAALATS